MKIRSIVSFFAIALLISAFPLVAPANVAPAPDSPTQSTSRNGVDIDRPRIMALKDKDEITADDYDFILEQLERFGIMYPDMKRNQRRKAIYKNGDGDYFMIIVMAASTAAENGFGPVQLERYKTICETYYSE